MTSHGFEPIAAFATPAPVHTGRRCTNSLRSSRALPRSSRVPLRRLETWRPAHASLRRPSDSDSLSPAGDEYLRSSTAVALKSFLTKRAVRTQAFYYREMQDAPTHNWLLGFKDFQARASRNDFRDNGEFLDSMLRAEKFTTNVTIGHPRGYFKREYKFHIDPYKVASRVLASRLQLSQEWAHDLGCIDLENKEVERMALESMLEADSKKLQSLKGRVFDHDNFNHDQSPLRFKNYRKLRLLVTQQAIARYEILLRDTSNHDYMYFRSFVKKMQPLTDDEVFIVALMNQAPETRVNPNHVVNPKAMARGLMEARAEVAAECKRIMQSVPSEHEAWERQRLEASMSISMNPIGEDYKKLEEEKPSHVDDSNGIEDSQPSSANANPGQKC